MHKVDAARMARLLREARRACARLGRADLAEDVMSEALVRTLPRLSKVRHPDAYLRRVAQTAAADMCAADGRELARRKGLGVSG